MTLVVQRAERTPRHRSTVLTNDWRPSNHPRHPQQTSAIVPRRPQLNPNVNISIPHFFTSHHPPSIEQQLTPHNLSKLPPKNYTTHQSP